MKHEGAVMNEGRINSESFDSGAEEESWIQNGAKLISYCSLLSYLTFYW
jgi:hypothetical protein